MNMFIKVRDLVANKRYTKLMDHSLISKQFMKNVIEEVMATILSYNKNKNKNRRIKSRRRTGKGDEIEIALA